jgi:hypothetical protein
MRVTNNFGKGWNRDIAFTRAGNDSLYKGLNIELTTNYERGSTLSITNTRGNKIYLTFPDTKNVYKYIPQQGSNTITLNGHTYTYNTAGGIKFIADQLKIEFATEIAQEQFKIQANNQYILIISCGIDPVPTIVGGTLDIYIQPEVNLSCIGYGRVNEKLVLYTTNKANIEPVTGQITVGQIWVVEFDYVNNTILDTIAPTYELSLYHHMVYEEYLDFYLTHAIYNETIGREENQFLGRQYFTDNYNYLRVANVYNPDLFAVPPDLLDVKPAFNQSIPIIQQVADGGNIPVGSIEFAYYLKTVDGAITNYSPKSNLINLTQSGIQTAYVDFEGSETGLNSNKAVSIKIDGVDTRYDYLVLAVVEYSTKDVPLIYDVAEIAIDSDTVEYTYTGSEQKIPVLVADFVNPRVQFKTAKSITYKKNRLYPANTTTPNLFTDWDSRAYRFKRVAQNPGFLIYSEVYSKEGSYQYIDTNFQVYSENGVSVTPYVPPDSMDLVNPYNDESGTVYGTQGATPDYNLWTTTQQFKMQADGITLGGEGENIKYKFITHSQPADTLQVPFLGAVQVDGKFYRQGQLASSFTGPTPTQVDPIVPTLNQNYMGVLGQVYPIGYPQSGNKNIYTASLFCGYPRGEVCRFGIVFVTDKGEEYEAKWIADIRFPEPWESSTGQWNLSSAPTIQGPINLNIIGLEFTIKDTTQLPPEVTGFYFVRMERKAKDKTRLGQGIQLSPLRTGQALYNFDNGSANNVNTFQESDNPGVSLLGTNTDDNIEINGNPNNCYYLGFKLPTRAFSTTFDSYASANYGACASSWLMAQNFDSTVDFNGQSSSRLFTIKSPEHDFDVYNFDATHLKTVHFYQSIETNYFDPELTGVDFGDLTTNANTRVDAWWVKLMKVGYTFNHLINITKHRNVDIEDIVPASYDTYMQWDYYNIAIRPNNQNGELAGGGAKHIFGLTDVDNISVQSTLPNYPQLQYLHRVSSMCKYNFGQYGGPWRVNRYGNVYIQCNHFQPIDTVQSPQQVTLVFGGDTYTNFYSTMLYCFPWIEDWDVPERGGVGSGLYPGYAYTDDMKGVSLVFPCESTINTEMRHGTYWNKSQLPTFNSTKFASFQFDEFLYNYAYGQQNNIKSFVSRPVNFRPSEQQPNFTWASNSKLDGENVDQWRVFPINQYLPAEGTYGQINRIVNFKDNLFVYQERAISILNSQQVSSVPTTDGTAFTVGLGNILSFYDYTNGSVKTGTQHQFSVLVGSDTIFSWDNRLQKMFMYTPGGPTPFSDIEGLSGYFRGISRGVITNTDKPLLRVGVHGGYDTKYNKAYFTFSNEINIACIPFAPFNQTFEITTPIFSVLQDLFVTGDEISIVPLGNEFPDNTTGVITIDLDNQKAYVQLKNVIGTIPNFRAKAYFAHTISYNKLLNCFESEHSFKPTLYIGTDEQFITANPFDINNTLWLHNVGLYGSFYNQVYPWNFEFLVTTTGEANEETSRVDYVDFWSQILDLNNKSIDVSPLDSIIFENDYQSTVNSLTGLTLNSNIKKFERTFRINEVYDYLATSPIKPYLRDKYVKIKAGNDNVNNYKYIINSWGTNITNSFH